MENEKIEKVTLENGRMAERRTHQDEDGNEVVELFVEPKRNLSLDKRIINKKKEILSEQRIQTIRNGEVVEEEVFSIEPQVRLEKREHIQKEGYEETGDYVTKDQLGKAIVEGVTAAMTPVIQSMHAYSVPHPVVTPLSTQPQMTAQATVEQHVEDKIKSDKQSFIIFSAIAVAQVIILVWLNMGF